MIPRADSSGIPEPDPAEIARGVDLLCEPGLTYELRGLDTRQGTCAGYYNEFSQLAIDACRVSAVGTYRGVAGYQAACVWLTLNPVVDTCLARLNNHFKCYAKKGELTTDKDIIRRRRLLFDVDPERLSGISSTDHEHSLALARAVEMREFLQQFDIWTALCDSGNGGHLIGKTDVPVDELTTELVKRSLRVLHGKFGGGGIKIDEANSNLSRCVKLYGTVARKGEHLSNRPHRLAQIIELSLKPDTFILREHLEKLIDRLSPKEPPRGAARSTSKPQEFKNHRSLTQDEIAEALNYVGDVDDRDCWLRVGMALKSEFGGAGRPLWDRWAQRSTKYHLDDQDKTWNSIDATGGVTIGTLIKLARDGGWNGPQRAHADAHRQNGRANTEDFFGGDFTASSGLDHVKNDAEPYEPPIPLNERRLLELPADVLPSVIGNMVDEVSAFTETPRELGLFDALGAIAGCTQKRFVIEGRPGYREPVNLWTIAALPSGNRKTAVINAMAEPLIEFERAQLRRLAFQIEAQQQARELAELRIADLKKKCARARTPADFDRIKAEISQMQKNLPSVPRALKLWEQDITPEKLGVVLAENGGAISIISDEGGIFDILAGLYSQKATPNLDAFLKAHSGSQIRVGRVNRAPVDVRDPALTMCLSPQPDVLQGLVSKPQFRGRGLLARPLYALPVSLLGRRKNKGTPVRAETRAAYHECLQTILTIEPQRNVIGDIEPYVLKLSAEAYETWYQFQQEIEAEMCEDGRLSHITDWAGKLPGQLLRVVANVHIVTFANTILANLIVADDVMRKTVDLGSVLIDHALAAFGLMAADPAIETAKKIWRHIEKRRVCQIRERDALNWVSSRIKSMELIRLGLDALVEHGYLDETLPALHTTSARGRPAGQVYNVCQFYRSQWSSENPEGT